MNNELQTRLDTTEQELNKMKMINYKLALRLKSLDLIEDEQAFLDIY